MSIENREIDTETIVKAVERAEKETHLLHTVASKILHEVEDCICDDPCFKKKIKTSFVSFIQRAKTTDKGGEVEHERINCI